MTTRSRILITSGVVPVVFSVLTLLQLNNDFFTTYKPLIIPAVLSLIMLIAVAWIVNFRLKGERLFTVLAYPALSIGLVAVFLDLVISTAVNNLDRISTAIGFALVLAVLTYILTSTINILNLAVQKNVPLSQAAKAAHYVLTMVFSYFAFVLVVSFEINFLIKAGLIFLLIFTYTFVALWTIAQAYSQRLISSLAIALILVFAFLTLAIWPLESFYFALFLTLVYYMNLGVALEIREILSQWMWYEYFAIFLVILILLLTTAVWGINGSII